MLANASLFRPFTDTNVYETGSVKIWKTRQKVSMDIRIFLQCVCVCGVLSPSWTEHNCSVSVVRSSLVSFTKFWSVEIFTAKFERDHTLRGRQTQVWWVKIGHFRRKTRYNSKTEQEMPSSFIVRPRPRLTGGILSELRPTAARNNLLIPHTSIGSVVAASCTVH